MDDYEDLGYYEVPDAFPLMPQDSIEERPIAPADIFAPLENDGQLTPELTAQLLAAAEKYMPLNGQRFTEEPGQFIAPVQQPQIRQPEVVIRPVSQAMAIKDPLYAQWLAENPNSGGTIDDGYTYTDPKTRKLSALKADNFIRNNETGEVTILSNPDRERKMKHEANLLAIQKANEEKAALQAQQAKEADAVISNIYSKQESALKAKDYTTKQRLLGELTEDIAGAAQSRMSLLESEYKNRYGVTQIEAAFQASIQADIMEGVRGMSPKTAAIGKQLQVVEKSYKSELMNAYRSDPQLKQLNVLQKGIAPLEKQTLMLAAKREEKLQQLALLDPQQRMQAAILGDRDAWQLQVEDISKRSGKSTDEVNAELGKVRGIVVDKDTYLKALDEMSSVDSKQKAAFALNREEVKKMGAEAWKQNVGSRMAFAEQYFTAKNQGKLMKQVDSWYSDPEAAPVFQKLKAEVGNGNVTMDAFVNEFVKGAPTPQLRAERLERIKSSMLTEIEKINKGGFGKVSPTIVNNIQARIGVSDALGGLATFASPAVEFGNLGLLKKGAEALDLKHRIPNAYNDTLEFLANLGR